MEINGQDLIFKRSGQIDVKLGVIEAVSQIWPDFVYEHCEDTEFFIYKNKEAFEAWENDVPDNPQYDDEMIYVLWNEDEVTLVIGDNADSLHEIQEITAKTQDILKLERIE